MKIKIILFICLISCCILSSGCTIAQNEMESSTDNTEVTGDEVNNSEHKNRLSCLYVYPDHPQTVELSEASFDEINGMWNTKVWEACALEIDSFYMFRGENLEIGYNHIIGAFVDLNTKKQSNLSKEENAWLSRLLSDCTVLPKIEIQSIEKCLYSETGQEYMLSEENALKMIAILNSDAWEKGVTKEMYAYRLEASDNVIYYANSTENGTLNDWTNDRHLILSEEQTELINSILKDTPMK